MWRSRCPGPLAGRVSGLTRVRHDTSFSFPHHRPTRPRPPSPAPAFQIPTQTHTRDLLAHPRPAAIAPLPAAIRRPTCSLHLSGIPAARLSAAWGSRAYVASVSTRYRAAEPRPCKSHFPHQQRRQHPSSHRPYRTDNVQHTSQPALASALDTTSNAAHRDSTFTPKPLRIMPTTRNLPRLDHRNYHSLSAAEAIHAFSKPSANVPLLTTTLPCA